MKTIIKILAIIALFITLVPSLLFFFGQVSEGTSKIWMMIGTLLWFATASFWLGKKNEEPIG